MNEIFKRVSVRSYLDKEVEDEKILMLLKAGMQAPSAANQQPWEFLVIKDKEKLRKLSEFSIYSKMLENCGVAIIVLQKNGEDLAKAFGVQDLGACTQNILLEAVSQGLGAVWLGTHPLEDKEKFIADLFEIPNKVTPFCDRMKHKWIRMQRRGSPVISSSVAVEPFINEAPLAAL